ncbi:MAG: hypothetical protein KF861_04135 [Planctomycetaceae bacterium]|nr:hypothetical protein [Planctomycetaceae bacterium]
MFKLKVTGLDQIQRKLKRFEQDVKRASKKTYGSQAEAQNEVNRILRRLR